MIILQNQWKTNVLLESILLRTSLCSYFVSWKIYLFICRKITFMSSTEIIIPFRIFLWLRPEKDVFYGVNFCNEGILWKKCGIYFCNPNVLTKFFQWSIYIYIYIYMGITYMSFLLRNLLFKNIYIMLPFMWSNEIFNILKWWLCL